MEITWEPLKQEKLKRERGIDLDEIRALIESNAYFEILKHPSKPGQYFIPLKYKSYIYLAVVKIETEKMIIKTCYPSRKANRKYSRS
jgi:16S rRNA G527 N7-methylase RsmG